MRRAAARAASLSRLQHDDFAAFEPRLAEQRERHTGRLARAGRSLKHGSAPVPERISQRGRTCSIGSREM